METIQGKIEWLADKPNEYPKGSGSFSVSIKVQNEFYNKYGPEEELTKFLETVKWGYEIKIDVEDKRIEKLEVISDKVEKKKSFGGYKTDPQSMYVSYVKDIFCSDVAFEGSAKDRMQECIDLIKQAKEAFK